MFFEQRSRSYENLMGYGQASRLSLTGAGEPARLSSPVVTGDFFSVLGSRADLGRAFEEGDGQPGYDRVVLLSQKLFKNRFDGDPHVIGRAITLDGVERTVVGVMPADFAFPSRDVDVWLPATFDPRQFRTYWLTGALHMVGRLRPGVSVERAGAELRELMPAIRGVFPWHTPETYGMDADVEALRERIVGGVRPILLVLMAAVGLVCADLLCQHGESRAREGTEEAPGDVDPRRPRGRARQLPHRPAPRRKLDPRLGGRRRRVGPGGAAGIFWLRALLPESMPRLEDIGIDLRVAGFTLVVSLLTGLAIASCRP